MTARDILDNNRDLIDRASADLATRKPHPMMIATERRPNRPPLILIQATNVTRIDTAMDIPVAGRTERRWFASRAVTGGRARLDPEEILDPGTHSPARLEVSGYEGETLVARRRGAVPLA